MVLSKIIDIGCGGNKLLNSIGMDKRHETNVDVVHDIEIFPWPFASDCFHKAIMNHVMEHMKPWLVMDIMNEIWRILDKDGQLELVMPIAGSTAFYSDPTHIKSWNIHTVSYFDIKNNFWKIYKPKPWVVLKNIKNNKDYLEIILQKVKG